MTDTLAIAYIGKKAEKTFRGFYFDHRFAVRQVPDNLAAQMLKFPDVFVDARTLDDIKDRLTQEFEQEATPSTAAGLIAPLDALHLALQRCIDTGQAAAALDMALARLADVSEPTEPTEPTEPPPESENSDLTLAIQNAILSLDPNDTQHDFTAAGKPRVKAIERLLGQDVSAEQVETAFNELNH